MYSWRLSSRIYCTNLFHPVKHNSVPKVKSTQGKETESKYHRCASGVVQNFGVLWKQRGHLTSAGTSGYTEEHLDALLLPVEVAMIKVEAYKKRDNMEAKGNATDYDITQQPSPRL